MVSVVRLGYEIRKAHFYFREGFGASYISNFVNIVLFYLYNVMLVTLCDALFLLISCFWLNLIYPRVIPLFGMVLWVQLFSIQICSHLSVKIVIL